ncbi:MAG: hypothetical protein M1832_006149 [Thelocarpon impressellum]|nr:MAG: hypothetical protein M1832_006149 [Thelocarpon impressellum]
MSAPATEAAAPAAPAVASSAPQLTYAEVATHNTKKDVYIVVHDKVFNASSFVDEHPGGEEVLLDVSGQDATEAFEDVGHSDEAREILDGLFVADLKRLPGDPAPKVAAPSTATQIKDGSASGVGVLGFSVYAAVLIGGAAAWGAWKYLDAKKEA